MDFLKNITINLKATGNAAVLIAWMLCFTALAILAPTATFPLGMMGAMGILLVSAFGHSKAD